MRKIENGSIIGDCRPTEFRPVIEGGKFVGWKARLDDGTFTGRLPDEKRVKEKNPDLSGVSGHLCESNGIIYCWREPAGTM